MPRFVYRILYSDNSVDLEHRVNAAIEDGYLPAGGIAINPTTGIICQAVILAEEVESP